MRILLNLLLAASVVYAAEKPAKPGQKNLPVAPKTGIKTPGVQLPWAGLKAEAELEAPAKPDWIFFSTSAYFPAPDSIEKVDAKTNKKGDAIAGVSKPCGGMVSAFGSLWAPACGSSSLARIDAKTFKVSKTIAGGASNTRGNIAASSDSIWLLTDDRATLSRIDPQQNAVVGEMRVPAGCRSLTFGESALWLACPAQNKIYKINPATNLVDKTIEVSGEPISIAASPGAVWVLCRKDGKIERIDPKTDKVVKTIDLNVPGADGQLAFGENFLWVTQTGFPITRIDVTAEKEKVLQQFYGDAGGAITLSSGAIWLSNLKAGMVWRIDPKLVIGTIPE
jgi:streptogramin lyase